ncbi:hypothetical protein PCAR4_810078 [Paraburkholderia caribensis]|nr:hypothetical protein PCAR4_810078 [Paraburkholderia caribensis]
MFHTFASSFKLIRKLECTNGNIGWKLDWYESHSTMTYAYGDIAANFGANLNAAMTRRTVRLMSRSNHETPSEQRA